MATTAYVALGSNVGDRKAHLDAAVAALAGTPGVRLLAVSSYHETAPVGGPPGQGPFLNAAAAVETDLDPHALFGVLRTIEARAGRLRLFRWGRRTLDLDLLLFGDRIVATPDLEVPHPRMAVRRFVLAPLAEIAPEAVDPTTGRTVGRSLAQIDRRPSYLAILTPAYPGIREQVLTLVSRGLDAEVVRPWGKPPKALQELRYWRHYPWGVDWAGVPDRLTHALPIDRDDSGRWLVSEFWADRVLLDLLFYSYQLLSGTMTVPEPDASGQIHWPVSFTTEEVLAIRRDLLAPTLVAVVLPPGGLGTKEDRIWESFVRDASMRFNRDFPGDSYDSIKATADTFRASLDPSPILLPVEVAEPSTIAEEILAGCRASRP